MSPMTTIILAVALLLAACANNPQVQGQEEPSASGPTVQTNNPTHDLQQLSTTGQPTATMRSEGEGRDLEDRPRYQQMSNNAVADELDRYCPYLAPPCHPAPPDSLVREAARRGLIKFKSPPTQPTTECIVVSDGSGGGAADCR